MNLRHLLLGLKVFLPLPLLAFPVGAQTNVEVNAGIQFNFSTPGARSLGMGGAFLGLADDATAAYTNPAGLTTLTRPEVSFEGRQWKYTHIFTDRGRLFGGPTGQGIDTIAGLRNGESSNTVEGPSFLSFVYPHSRWRVALYRHELADFEADFRTQGAFIEGEDRLRPSANRLALKIDHLGLALAVKATESLSLGLGLSSYDFQLASRTDRFSTGNSVGGDLEPGGALGPPLFTSDNIEDSQLQEGNDRAIGFNAGFLWRIKPGWSLGGAYRQGPKFDLKAASLGSIGAPESLIQARFDTPDFLGMGLAIQPTETLTLNLDYVRVQYSDLTDQIASIVLDMTNMPADTKSFRVSDANEIRLGLEKAFLFSSSQVYTRLGAWRDPDHRISYRGEDHSFRALFRSGKSEIHYSAGFGVSANQFQIDCAVDLSEQVDTISLSSVARF